MFKLTTNPDSVVRISDGANIPRGHRWWQEYQEWLAAGNTPDPADVIDYTAGIRSLYRELRGEEVKTKYSVGGNSDKFFGELIYFSW